MKIFKCYVLAMSCFTLTFCTENAEGSEQEEIKMQTSSYLGHHENNKVPGAIRPDVNGGSNLNLAYYYNLYKEKDGFIKILREFRTSINSLCEYEEELIKYEEIYQEIANSLVYVKAPIILDAKTFDLYRRYFETIRQANEEVLSFFVSFNNILTEAYKASYTSREISLIPTELLNRQIDLFVLYHDIYLTHLNIFKCIENYATENNDENLLARTSIMSALIKLLSSHMAKFIKNLQETQTVVFGINKIF